jgi:glutathione S-transferase
MTPMAKIVTNSLRPLEERDIRGVTEARTMLDTAYQWLDERMAAREWASGDDFNLADCAAAPALFYADWAHPVGSAYANVHAYRRRLLARPSVARAVDEAGPCRHLFPLGMASWTFADTFGRPWSRWTSSTSSMNGPKQRHHWDQSVSSATR